MKSSAEKAAEFAQIAHRVALASNHLTELLGAMAADLSDLADAALALLTDATSEE